MSQQRQSHCGVRRAAGGDHSLAAYLAPDFVIEIAGGSRAAAVAELVACLGRRVKTVSVRRMVAAIEARERIVSTRISEQVALPHAVLPLTRTHMVFGRSRSGVPWDGGDAVGVQLVALIVGPRSDHLQALALIADRLSQPASIKALLAAPGPPRIYELLTQGGSAPGAPPPGQDQITQDCLRRAVQLARAVKANALLVHTDNADLRAALKPLARTLRRLFVVAELPSRAGRGAGDYLHVPFLGRERSGQVDVALLAAVSQNLLHPTDRVVSVCGLPGAGILDTIRVTDLAWEYSQFAGLERSILPSDLQPQVMLRTLQVAARIAAEGREGESVGAIFVAGDTPRVRRYCRQMIMNPFRGYNMVERNILDPGLEETIKEFARLDGAFVVRGDGALLSAGTYLRPETEVPDLPKGLGARHAAAAAITIATGALAVAVSQSTHRISLFKNGRRVLAFQPL